MAQDKQIVTDSEYKIMQILWSSDEKMTVSEVSAKLSENDWSASTVSTFLQRLLKKSVVGCEKKGKANLYYSLIKRREYDLGETESFVKKLYQGSAKKLVAALFESKKLSREDLAELGELIKESKE